jgi:outer membrane protein TolC
MNLRSPRRARHDASACGHRVSGNGDDFGAWHEGQVISPAAKSALISAPVPQNTFALAVTAAYPPQAQSALHQRIRLRPIRLTLKQAEALAIKQNPQISVGRLSALAARQVTREARSALWPTAAVDLTAVDARDNSRITAGGLNNPIIYDRAAAGANVSQLITDFGHTTNLDLQRELCGRGRESKCNGDAATNTAGG